MDINSYTPILTAAFHGHTKALLVLQERGAKVDVLDKNEKSVLFIAAENNHLETLEVGCRGSCHLCMCMLIVNMQYEGNMISTISI